MRSTLTPLCRVMWLSLYHCSVLSMISSMVFHRPAPGRAWCGYSCRKAHRQTQWYHISQAPAWVVPQWRAHPPCRCRLIPVFLSCCFLFVQILYFVDRNRLCRGAYRISESNNIALERESLLENRCSHQIWAAFWIKKLPLLFKRKNRMNEIGPPWESVSEPFWWFLLWKRWTNWDFWRNSAGL